MANSEFATYGEYLDYMANASEHAGINTQSLAEQFKALAGSEIKPKDADSMDEWLASLSNTDLTKVQDVLLNCGDYADELSAILSNMSGADAASYLVDVYNDFYGILQDCTEAYDEFNTAVNKIMTKKLLNMARCLIMHSNHQTQVRVLKLGGVQSIT